MLARPFAPFRSRPVRRINVRKVLESGLIAELAAEAPAGLRALKGQRRLIKPGSGRMRVLKPVEPQS